MKSRALEFEPTKTETRATPRRKDEHGWRARLKAWASQYQGGETIVDGHVIDDGYECDAEAEVIVSLDGVDMMRLDTTFSTDDPVPAIETPRNRMPHGITVQSSLERDLGDVTCDEADDMRANPLDYVDDESEIDELLLDAACEVAVTRAETELDACPGPWVATRITQPAEEPAPAESPTDALQ